MVKTAGNVRPYHFSRSTEGSGEILQVLDGDLASQVARHPAVQMFTASVVRALS